MKRVGITIGDVNGIGVEVILKALAYGRWSQATEFVLLGSEAVVRKQAEVMKIPLSRRLRFHDVGEAMWKPGRLRSGCFTSSDSCHRRGSKTGC